VVTGWHSLCTVSDNLRTKQFIDLAQRLSGFPPFQEEDELPLFEQIKNGIYEFPYEFWCDVSDQGMYPLVFFT
jgi:hypothetical protein